MMVQEASLHPGLQDIGQAVRMAFRTAHLLTANVRQAESAVLEAIDSFDPEVDTGDTLFQNAILVALQFPKSQSAESFEPLELQAVLGLSENLRRCFVLRVLVGVSRRSCARLLGLNTGAVNDYTCAALQRLGGV